MHCSLVMGLWEDAEMISAMEKANLIVIGPGSNVIQQAGFKDEAKRTALKVGYQSPQE